MFAEFFMHFSMMNVRTLTFECREYCCGMCTQVDMSEQSF
jgi:hypothetical protein